MIVGPWSVSCIVPCLEPEKVVVQQRRVEATDGEIDLPVEWLDAMEVYVDEYPDSAYVQRRILRAAGREP